MDPQNTSSVWFADRRKIKWGPAKWEWLMAQVDGAGGAKDRRKVRFGVDGGELEVIINDLGRKSFKLTSTDLQWHFSGFMRKAKSRDNWEPCRGFYAIDHGGDGYIERDCTALANWFDLTGLHIIFYQSFEGGEEPRIEIVLNEEVAIAKADNYREHGLVYLVNLRTDELSREELDMVRELMTVFHDGKPLHEEQGLMKLFARVVAVDRSMRKALASQPAEKIAMNLYWFVTTNKTLRHVILAPTETEAWEILRANEKDILISDFELEGVTLNVSMQNPGELAVVWGKSSELHPESLDERKKTKKK